MTAHDHAEFVPGCYRCDLSREEVKLDRLQDAEGRLRTERNEAIALLRSAAEWIDRSDPVGYALATNVERFLDGS